MFGVCLDWTGHRIAVSPRPADAARPLVVGMQEASEGCICHTGQGGVGQECQGANGACSNNRTEPEGLVKRGRGTPERPWRNPEGLWRDPGGTPGALFKGRSLKQQGLKNQNWKLSWHSGHHVLFTGDGWQFVCNIVPLSHVFFLLYLPMPEYISRVNDEWTLPIS